MNAKKIIATLTTIAMLVSLLGISTFAATPVGEFGTFTVTKADGTDGGTYDSFKAAFAVINADISYEGCTLDCEAGKLIPFGGNHISVKRSFTLNGNGSTGVNTKTSTGEADFAIDFGGVNLDADTTIVINDFGSATIWGSRTSGYVLNITLNNCDTNPDNINDHRVYLNGTGGTTNITIIDCDYTTEASNCALYSNAPGTITVKNSTYTGINEPININNKSEGIQTVNIKNVTFTDCGLGTAGDELYAAPIRVLASNEKAVTNVTVDTCSFIYNGTASANGDILIGDGRENKDSYFVGLSVENTDAEIQLQEPGDRVAGAASTADVYEITSSESIELANVNGTPAVVNPANTLWDGSSVDTSWYDSSKTTFVLTSAAQLAGLAELTDNGNNFAGKTVYLAADIDLNNKEWNPVGTNNNQFAGTFDGNGKTISNLYISKAQYGAALFGGVSGTVKNFTVNNAYVHNTSLYTAAAVGCGNCIIENITLNGDIDIYGYWYVGGIHGNGYSKVRNCHVNGNSGSVIGASVAYVGGIKGFSGENAQETVDCSVKNVDIKAATYVGGLQGILHYENIVKNSSLENVNIYVEITPEEAGSDQHDVFCGGLIAGNTSNAAYPNAYSSVKNFTYTNAKVIFADGTINEQPLGAERNNRESDTVGAFVGGNSYSDINEAIAAAKTENKPIVLYQNYEDSEITTDVSGVTFTSTDFADYTLTKNDDSLVFCKYTDGSSMYVEKTAITSNATVKFLPTADERVYDIAIEADNGAYLNRLSNIDLTFANANKKIAYEISGRTDGVVSVNGVPGEDDRYEFHFNGEEQASETGGYVVMGQVKFTGYGALDFSVAAAETNKAHGAELKDSIVMDYIPDGDTDADDKTGKIIIGNAVINNVEYKEATTEVKVVIEFNNNITSGNTAFYNDMTVTLTGANGKVYTGKVGNDADTEDINYEDSASLVTFVFPEVVVGENGYYYTATVKGAGYRNASLTKRLTADSTDKTYLFWNNVKDVEGDSFLAGDIVKDNIINIYDLSAVVSYFGEEGLDDDTNPGYAKYDLNRDGKIDSKDVAYVLVSWGK